MDGVYVVVVLEEVYVCMVIDVMVEMMVNWDVVCVFGMVGYLNFGFVDVLCW